MKVIEGDGPPPNLVYELIRGLPDDSMTAALRQGGMQFMGWGTDRYIASYTYDSLNTNTVVTGNWTKKPPTPTPFPRPTKTVKEKAKATVASVFAMMQGKYGR